VLAEARAYRPGHHRPGRAAVARAHEIFAVAHLGARRLGDAAAVAQHAGRVGDADALQLRQQRELLGQQRLDARTVGRAVREVGLEVERDVAQPEIDTLDLAADALRQHGGDVLGGDAAALDEVAAAGPLREPDQGHHQREQQQVEPQQPPIEAGAAAHGGPCRRGTAGSLVLRWHLASCCRRRRKQNCVRVVSARRSVN